MAHIENEVKLLIYRIAQEVDSKRLSFWVYNDLIEETEATKLLTHEELYTLLCEKVQYYHQGGFTR